MKPTDRESYLLFRHGDQVPQALSDRLTPAWRQIVHPQRPTRRDPAEVRPLER